MAENIGPIMQQMLDRYGLGSLATWLSQRITAGASPEQVELELYDRPEFITRFPAIRIRGREGLPPLSVDEYLAYENTMNQMAKAFGTTLTKEQTDAMLAANVSASEGQERLGMYAKAVYQSPPEVRNRLETFYGISTGDMVGYLTDPKTQLPVLQRRFAAADIAASAMRAGYDRELSAEQGERLFEAGVTGESALEGFGQLIEAEELFEAVDVTEEDLDLDQQLSLLAGNQDLAAAVATRGERRAARFQEGGAFSTGREGVAGLGSANR